jgi:hypothetical protein
MLVWEKTNNKKMLNDIIIGASYLRHYYSTVAQQERDFAILILSIQSCVYTDFVTATNIANDLRERYPGWELFQISDAINGGRWHQDRVGGSIFLLRQEFDPETISMAEAERIAELLTTTTTRVGELLNTVGEFSSQNAIGNTKCKFNACSVYLRCAVNPCGPCDECNFFEER